MSITIARPRLFSKNFREALSRNVESGTSTPPEITLGTNDRASQELGRVLRGEPRVRFPVPSPSELMKNGLARMKKESKSPANTEKKKNKRLKPESETQPLNTNTPKRGPAVTNKPQAIPPTNNKPRLMFDKKEKNWVQKLFAPRTPAAQGPSRQPQATPIGKTSVRTAPTNTPTTTPKKSLLSRIFHRNPQVRDTPSTTPQRTETRPSLGRRIVTGLRGVFGPTPNGPNGTYVPRLMFDKKEKNWVQKLFQRKNRP